MGARKIKQIEKWIGKSVINIDYSSYADTYGHCFWCDRLDYLENLKIDHTHDATIARLFPLQKHHRARYFHPVCLCALQKELNRVRKLAEQSGGRVPVRENFKNRTALRQKTTQPARKAVMQAIQGGKLPSIAEQRCKDCGKAASVYHHYLGYEVEHWLDVVPLCKICHKARHMNGEPLFDSW